MLPRRIAAISLQRADDNGRPRLLSTDGESARANADRPVRRCRQRRRRRVSAADQYLCPVEPVGCQYRGHKWRRDAPRVGIRLRSPGPSHHQRASGERCRRHHGDAEKYYCLGCGPAGLGQLQRSGGSQNQRAGRAPVAAANRRIDDGQSGTARRFHRQLLRLEGVDDDRHRQRAGPNAALSATH